MFSDYVKQAAFGQWDNVLRAICGLSEKETTPTKRGMPCPHCGGHDRYEFKSPDDGYYLCRGCGAGDGFKMLMAIQSCNFSDAVQIVARHLGVDSEYQVINPLGHARIAARAAARKRYSEERLAEEALQKSRKQEEVAASIPDRLAKATSASPQYPYLARKQLPTFGLKQDQSALLIPLYCRGHRLVNLERITPEGKKLSLKGGLRKGIYHRFGDKCQKVCTCESWSTAASIYLLENKAVRVYAAMGKGNLAEVAKIAKEQNPDSDHFIAADNDTHLPNNPGLTEAVKAAEAIGAVVIVPPVIPGCDKGADFSDYYLANGGRDAVE